MSLDIQIGANVQGAVRGIEEVSLTLNEQKAVLKNLQREYASLSTIQARSSVGKELAADIKIANSEIKRLESAGTSAFGAVGNGATKAFSALRNLAYVLPGVGIAGILSFGIEGVASLFNVGKEADKTAEKLKDLIKPIDELKASAIGGSAEETSKVKILADVILDQTKSYKERNNALLQLKDINKNYFGDLTLESDKLATLKGRVDEYTKALVAASIVKAFGDDIGKVGKEVALQELAIKKTRDEIEKFSKSVDASGAPVIRIGEEEAKANKKIYELNQTLDKQNKTLAPLKKQYDDLGDALRSAVDESLKFKPLDVDDTKIKKLKEKLEKGFIFKGKVELEIVDLAKINNPELVGKGAKFEAFKKTIEDQFKGEEFKPIQLSLPVDVQLRLTEKFKGVQELQSDLNQIFSKFSLDIATAFGEELGNALSGNTDALRQGFKSIIGIIGDAIKQMGRALIQYGIVKTGLDKVLKAGFALPGATAVALGVLAVAAGQLVKSLAVKGFAQGGLVFGPTLGLVGEGSGTSRSNPEVIAPLDQLKGMLGGLASNNVQVQLAGVVKGNDLALLIDRNTRYRSRNV